MTNRRRPRVPSWVRSPAGVVLVLLLIVCVFGDLLAPHDPLGQDTSNAFAGISWAHPMGTDPLGRDTFSRLLAGTRVSVLSAAASVAIAFALGALPGMASAFVGRAPEYMLLRIVDSLMMLPPLIFAIAVIGSFGNGLAPAIVSIGVLMTPRFFRIFRAETLGLVGAQYVEAAVLLGASWHQILRRHVWRKLVPTAAVTLATGMGYAVLAMASLGFLGLGVIAPNPSWGSMLSVDLSYLYQEPYAAIWPGLAVVLTVWAFNALADRATRPAAPRLDARDIELPALEADHLVLEPQGNSVVIRESV